MSPPSIFNHQPRRVGATVQERINALGIGQKMQDLPEHLWHESFRFYVKEDPTREGGPNLRMIRLDPEKPSLTVTAYIFNKFVHPYEDRFITPREAARLQGFPDEIEFKGSLTSAQMQVGNAVPVPLGKAVFQSILEHATETFPMESKFNALSLFSGAGGLDIAARQASNADKKFHTFACVEIDSDCCKTLGGYLGKDTRILQQDISTITDPIKFLEACGISAQEISVIYGGPPCQAFSQAGKQKGVEDPRGQMIDEFLRFVEAIRPRYFLMENVKGLKGIGKGKLMAEVIHTMESLGYHVTYDLLNAADFGAAQLRKRLIFVGTRTDVGKVALPLPTHSPTPDLFTPYLYTTVGEAFAEIPAC